VTRFGTHAVLYIIGYLILMGILSLGTAIWGFSKRMKWRKMSLLLPYDDCICQLHGVHTTPPIWDDKTMTIVMMMMMMMKMTVVVNAV